MDPTTLPPSGLDWQQVVLIVASLVLTPLVGVLVAWLRKAILERDTVIRGVEASGSPEVKAYVRGEAMKAGIDKQLDATVKRATTKLPRKPPSPMAVLLVLPLLAGCASGLQAGYVRAMEKTYDAVQLDVREGLYKPDARSRETLKRWDQANADARAVLDEEAR